MTTDQNAEQCISLCRRLYPAMHGFAFHISRTTLTPNAKELWRASISLKETAEDSSFLSFSGDAHNIEFAVLGLLRSLRKVSGQSVE